jgi:cyclase
MPRNIRIISRLDIKAPNLIKGIQFEGLRVMGLPQEYAEKYYYEGADELLCIDTVASLYNRNNILNIVKDIADEIFIPLTVGGGLRCQLDVKNALRSGADKVAINTAAVKNPNLLSNISKDFGSQCVVLSIEAKKINTNQWEVYTDNGRERTNIDVFNWIEEASEYGIGEVLITSVDKDGTQKGFDIELCQMVSNIVKVPIIVSGGMGSLEDFDNLVKYTDVDAVAIGSVLHYNKISITDIRTRARMIGLEVRSLC